MPLHMISFTWLEAYGGFIIMNIYWKSRFWYTVYFTRFFTSLCKKVMIKINKILNLSVINIVIKYKFTDYYLLLMMLTCHKIMFVLRHVSVRLVFENFVTLFLKIPFCFKYADVVKPSNELYIRSNHSAVFFEIFS